MTSRRHHHDITATSSWHHGDVIMTSRRHHHDITATSSWHHGDINMTSRPHPTVTQWTWSGRVMTAWLPVRPPTRPWKKSLQEARTAACARKCWSPVATVTSHRASRRRCSSRRRRTWAACTADSKVNPEVERGAGRDMSLGDSAWVWGHGRRFNAWKPPEDSDAFHRGAVGVRGPRTRKG